MENDEQLEWRDTYFILFQQSDRPTLTQVEAAITESSKRLKLENLEADEDGMFESVLVQARRTTRPWKSATSGAKRSSSKAPNWPSS